MPIDLTLPSPLDFSPDINIINVQLRSTCISSIEYNTLTGYLIVHLIKDGATYGYSDVPPALIYQMMFFYSSGLFYSKNIRNNFSYERLG